MRSIRSSRRSAAFLVAAVVVVAPLTVGSAAGAAAPERVHAQASSGPSSGEVLATLKVTSGTVSVRKDGKKKFKPATDGQALRQGDTIKTDATGTAEVDYGNDAFTRLDVSTTFTIVVLTDEQGSRQVQGSLESGQTWNRTAALTESGSFEQEGAGANATVRGTAFSILCDTVDHCTFTAVVDDIDLTGLDGVTRLLTPLTQCESNDTSENGEVRDLTGVLCGDISQIPADQIPDWIIQNLLKDLLLGLPDGGILTGTVVISDDGTVSFVPTPAPAPAVAPAPPVIDAKPVLVLCGNVPPEDLSTCVEAVSTRRRGRRTEATTTGTGSRRRRGGVTTADAPPPDPNIPASGIWTSGSPASFRINATPGPSGLVYTIVFVSGPATTFGQIQVDGTPITLATNYASGTVFTFVYGDFSGGCSLVVGACGTSGVGATGLISDPPAVTDENTSVKVVNAQGESQPVTIPITVDEPPSCGYGDLGTSSADGPEGPETEPTA